MIRPRCACSSPASLVPLTRPVAGSKLVFLLEERMDGEKIACSSRLMRNGRLGRNNTLPCSSATVVSLAMAGVTASAQLACAIVERRLNSDLRPPRVRVADRAGCPRYRDLPRRPVADLTLAAPLRPPDARPSASVFPVWRAPWRASRAL